MLHKDQKWDIQGYFCIQFVVHKRHALLTWWSYLSLFCSNPSEWWKKCSICLLIIDHNYFFPSGIHPQQPDAVPAPAAVYPEESLSGGTPGPQLQPQRHTWAVCEHVWRHDPCTHQPGGWCGLHAAHQGRLRLFCFTQKWQFLVVKNGVMPFCIYWSISWFIFALNDKGDGS